MRAVRHSDPPELELEQLEQREQPEQVLQHWQPLRQPLAARRLQQRAVSAERVGFGLEQLREPVLEHLQRVEVRLLVPRRAVRRPY